MAVVAGTYPPPVVLHVCYWIVAGIVVVFVTVCLVFGIVYTVDVTLDALRRKRRP